MDNTIKNRETRRKLYSSLAIVLGFITGCCVAKTSVPWLNGIAVLCLCILFWLLVRTVFDGPLGPLVVRGNLERIGLVNRYKEAPFLLRNRDDPDVENGMILEFETRGIAREIWEKNQASLESALNIIITKIKDGKDRRRIKIYAVPADYGIPDMIEWHNGYIDDRDFCLALGRSVSGVVKINLASIPHYLVAGTTGSGKTVLLRLLLMQCVQKGASVYIADFKGGLDFKEVWHNHCHMIFDESKFLETLKELVGELNARKEVLGKAHCRTIAEYNSEVRPLYKRIIIACDEVAELLDKTGRSKEDKELIDKTVGYLSTIAREGRALGIHLLLATQRPDANIVPGQIKNNVACICGRADLVLSQVILGNGDAHDLIPKDAHGRFLMNDGTIFQAFWFEDNNWEFKDEWQ